MVQSFHLFFTQSKQLFGLWNRSMIVDGCACAPTNFYFLLEIIILAAWAIWITRNDFIFYGVAPNLYRCRKKFKKEMQWLTRRAARQTYANFEDWVLLSYNLSLYILFSTKTMPVRYNGI